MAMLDDALTDLQQRIAALERELDARTAERDEALAQQSATTEVLQVINSSPGDLFEAVLDKATRLCGASFGALTIYRGDDLHEVVAMRGMAPSINDLLGKTAHLGPETGMGRLVRGEPIVHIADARDDEGYHQGSPGRRALLAAAERAA